ncbi:hypothetical protein, partial [uncultured Intestinimonas sp.]|uniref:hypothetical protein n=1 Tax=uncultured Intestinimonas sp. TaxID=1689265 RepID=UPI0029428B72
MTTPPFYRPHFTTGCGRESSRAARPGRRKREGQMIERIGEGVTQMRCENCWVLKVKDEEIE